MFYYSLIRTARGCNMRTVSPCIGPFVRLEAWDMLAYMVGLCKLARSALGRQP
jgi:hypothetical protein